MDEKTLRFIRENQNFLKEQLENDARMKELAEEARKLPSSAQLLHAAEADTPEALIEDVIEWVDERYDMNFDAIEEFRRFLRERLLR